MFTANDENTRQGSKKLQKHRTDMAVNVLMIYVIHISRKASGVWNLGIRES